MRSEGLEPFLEILVQAPLVVIDEYRRGDVHRVDQGQAFLDARFCEAGLDLRRNVHERAAGGGFEP